MVSPILQLTPGTSLSTFDADGEAPSYLAQLAAGRQFRVTEPLYHLLACMERPTDPESISAALAQRAGITLDAAAILRLVETKLAPAGLVWMEGHPGAPAAARPAPGGALALRWRRELIPARWAWPISGALRHAYRPGVAFVLLALALGAHGVAYARLGFPPPIDGLTSAAPAIVAALVAMSLVHEFGHLAACRRWGCPHGGLGVGLYLLAPVFYADVSPAWRLPRHQRAIVDLGGIYFQLLCTPAFVALYLATGAEAWLWAVVICDLSALFNLSPFAKLDGYWLLSDALGIPNLHQRARELLPPAMGRAGAGALAPFGRVSRAASAVLAVYFGASLVVWPVLVAYQVVLVANVATLYAGLVGDAVFLAREATLGETDLLAQAALQIFLLSAMLLQAALMLWEAGRALARRARRWRMSHGMR